MFCYCIFKIILGRIRNLLTKIPGGGDVLSSEKAVFLAWDNEEEGKSIELTSPQEIFLNLTTSMESLSQNGAPFADIIYVQQGLWRNPDWGAQVMGNGHCLSLAISYLSRLCDKTWIKLTSSDKNEQDIKKILSYLVTVFSHFQLFFIANVSFNRKELRSLMHDILPIENVAILCATLRLIGMGSIGVHWTDTETRSAIYVMCETTLAMATGWVFLMVELIYGSPKRQKAKDEILQVISDMWRYDEEEMFIKRMMLPASIASIPSFAVHFPEVRLHFISMLLARTKQIREENIGAVKCAYCEKTKKQQLEVVTNNWSGGETPPGSKIMQTILQYTNKKTTFKRCGCGLLRYCGRSHQKKHWNTDHREYHLTFVSIVAKCKQQTSMDKEIRKIRRRLTSQF